MGVNEGSVQLFDNIKICPVTNRKEMKEFIHVPWEIYRDDPQWVPPLKLERQLHFSSFNPFFKNAQWQAWLAYRNNRPVGRICAHIDHNHRKHFKQDTGHFGLLEAENNPDIFTALLKVSEEWLLQRKTTHVTGPFNFSINDEKISSGIFF